MSNNLKIELKTRKDKNGNTFYLGKLRVPALIDLKDGCVFIIYTSELGCEELQIAPMDNRQKDMDE
jgi:hypothetical protein